MIPHYMASLWGSHTFQQGLLQSFILGSGIRYTGTSYGNNTEMFKVPAYNLYDLMAHYNLGEASSALKGTTVQFNVNNLTNKSTTSPPAAEPQRASTAPAVRCSLWSQLLLVITLRPVPLPHLLRPGCISSDIGRKGIA